MSNIPPAIVKLLHQIDAGWCIHCFYVPHRIVRLVRSDDWRKWRVEQLVVHSRGPEPTGAWKTLGSWSSEEPAICDPAIQAGLAANNQITAKLQKRNAQMQHTAQRVMT